MPLTPCHAAAAWPIRRMLPGAPLVPLVIGTMAPDFEYVLRLRPSGAFGHTAPGLFLFSLPAGMAAWGAFEVLVRPGLWRLLPVTVGRRAEWGRAAAAVLLGTVSHVAWDSFTHAGTWKVLETEAAFGLPWYTVLQHGSTILGGLALLAWARSLGPLALPRGAAARWFGLLAFTATGATLNGAWAPVRGLLGFLGAAAIGAMAAFAVALPVACRVRSASEVDHDAQPQHQRVAHAAAAVGDPLDVGHDR